MAKCMACGKTMLLPSSFANVTVCKHCGSLIGIPEWKSRDFSSLDELIIKKNEVLQKAATGNISQVVIEEITQYFDEYINAGFKMMYDGKVGQTLKVFDHYCIITTKNEGKKESLQSEIPSDDDEEDDDSVLSSDDKRTLAKGLMSGRIVQAGIGVAVSATLNKQEKEKNAEKKAHERQKNIDRLITAGERRVNYDCIDVIEAVCNSSHSVGYLKLVNKGAKRNTIYDCEYFFFNHSGVFKVKRIRQEVEQLKNMITEGISKCKNASMLASTQAEQNRDAQVYVQQNKIDAFEEIRKYKQLLDDGIISDEEYNIKKKQLLGL